MDISAARQALLELQTHGVEWAEEPERGSYHLEVRINAGDLPAGCELDDYEQLILGIATAGATKVFDDVRDSHGGGLALWGRGEDGKDWFVKVGAAGEIWTAFPPPDMAAYLPAKRYRYIGSVNEVLTWTPT